jgi:hypothetical protein
MKATRQRTAPPRKRMQAKRQRKAPPRKRMEAKRIAKDITQTSGGTTMLENSGKSLETWIWDAACSIRGAKDAPNYKEFILPLIFAKRLCDVFDDELNRIAKEVGSRAKAFKLVKHDKKLVRFYLPLEPNDPDEPVWSVIRTLSNKIGEQMTTHLRASRMPIRSSKALLIVWTSMPQLMVCAISMTTACQIWLKPSARSVLV